MKYPMVKKPCSNCPFRKDTLKSWLGRERMTEILNQDSFVCHKTTGSGQELKQCAGHMLLLKESNIFYRMLPKDSKPTGRELVFDSVKECIEHHAN